MIRIKSQTTEFESKGVLICMPNVFPKIITSFRNQNQDIA